MNRFRIIPKASSRADSSELLETSRCEFLERPPVSNGEHRDIRSRRIQIGTRRSFRSRKKSPPRLRREWSLPSLVRPLFLLTSHSGDSPEASPLPRTRVGNRRTYTRAMRRETIRGPFKNAPFRPPLTGTLDRFGSTFRYIYPLPSVRPCFPVPSRNRIDSSLERNDRFPTREARRGLALRCVALPRAGFHVIAEQFRPRNIRRAPTASETEPTEPTIKMLPWWLCARLSRMLMNAAHLD